MLDSIDLSDILKFQQENFCCLKHKLPKGAICQSEVCGNRFLCPECIQEHEDSHIQDVIHDEEFFKLYMETSMKKLAKQCLATLERHETTKIETKNFFKFTFDKARQQILKNLEMFEEQILKVVEKNSAPSGEDEKSLDKCKLELELLLTGDSQLIEKDLNAQLENVATIINTVKKFKESYEFEIMQAIETHSNDFMNGMDQELKDLKTALQNDLNKFKLSHLGSFLKAEAKVLKKFNNKVAGLSYSEKDESLVVLEGYCKLNSFQNLFDLNSMTTRVDFDKFEDNVTKLKWIQKESYLVCNNTNKWVKVHHPSKTCSEFSVEGPIQKLDYCEEMKLIIVTTDNLALCYQDDNPRMPLYYKMQPRTGLTDSCLISKKDSHLLVLGHRTGMITVYDLLKKREKCSFKAYNSAVSSLAYWSSKELLITTGQRGEIKVWKFFENQVKCLQTFINNGPLTNFVFIEEKNWMVFVSGEKNMVIYDCVSNKKLGMRKFSSKIVNPCYLKNTGKLVFGMERNLYEIQL